jgi:porin
MAVFKDPSLSFYNRMALARSASPYGLQYDIDKNKTGFTFDVDGSKPLFIDEFGYKTESSKDVLSTNARAGWIYNSTNYTNFRTGGEASNNYGGYVAFTQQVTQPDNESPRGLYFDAKFNYAPEDRNLYAKDYQVNFFYIGPFASRSSDMASLSYSRSYFSKDARRYFENLSDNDVAKFSTSYSFSYAAEVVRGMYAITGLTYQQGPSFNPDKPDALIFQESLYFSF